MFDKLKFNNLVISAKKDIQKANVQVVRKIIQKLRKLKMLVEKKPNNESAIIKLRKCSMVVESAKKIKNFEAITKILLLEKNPNKVVTNSRSTPEEVAIAMLAANPKMKLLSAKIIEELNLNQNDCQKWKKTLIEISKQKIKKQRRKKRKLAMESEVPSNEKLKKNKTIKSKKMSENEERKEEAVKNNISMKSISNETVSSDDNVELVSSDVDSVTFKGLNSQKSEAIKNKYDNSSEITRIEKAKKMKQSKPIKSGKINENEKFDISKKSNIDVFNSKIFEDDASSTNMESMSFSKHRPKTRQVEVKLTKVVDPFFVTATGEHYETLAPIIENNNESDEDNFSFKETKKDKHKEKPNFKNHEHENLHPSWAAKNKQRLNLEFQGKRKVLDDAVDKKIVNNQVATDLHPSWAAKQKLKPIIAAFQGKKIKFEED